MNKTLANLKEKTTTENTEQKLMAIDGERKKNTILMMGVEIAIK